MTIKEKYTLIDNKEKARRVLSEKTGLKDVRLINYFSRGVIPVKHQPYFDVFLTDWLNLEEKYNTILTKHFQL